MLNDRECKNAKRQEKPYKLPGGSGLYLEVKPKGVKGWRYRSELRQDGVAKESVFSIGIYASPPSAVPPTKVATPKPALHQAGHQQDQQHRTHAIEGKAAPRCATMSMRWNAGTGSAASSSPCPAGWPGRWYCLQGALVG